MPNESTNNSLLPTITNMINKIVNEGNDSDTLISILSLLSLILILNRIQPSMSMPLSQSISPAVSATTNPLQKILGELTKSGDGSGGGPSPDMLMSLLPLLNNPQVKSKLNPANISSILGMLGNLSGGGDKPEGPKTEKNEVPKTDKPQKKQPDPTAEASSVSDNPTPINVTHSDEQDNKDLGRSLNWKSNFQNDKEV